MTRLILRITALTLALMLGAGMALAAPTTSPAIATEFGCMSDECGGGGGGGFPPAPSNADLSGISLSAGTLSPAYSAATTSYSASVGTHTSQIVVGATPADPLATVTINGVVTQSASIALATGANTITLVTTAQDRTTTKTVAITVTRAHPSGNSALRALTVTGGTLTPAFDPGTRSYTVSVPSTTQLMSFLPAAADASATVSSAGTEIPLGVVLTTGIEVGANVVTFVVTAQDGTTSTYTVTVTRASPSDATLSAIELSAGTLSPAFSASTTSYTAAVGYATTEVTVGATTVDSAAAVMINGVETTGRTIPLSLGGNTISIVTTAQDGLTTLTTTVVVTRDAPNLDLTALSITGSTLSPAFDANTSGYTLEVPFTESSLEVVATALDPDWMVEIQGEETSTATVTVPVGVSTIAVTVTATHGESRRYTIDVTRAAPASDSALRELRFSNQTLSPAFAPDTMSYTLSVGSSISSAVITPMSADATATVTVNGASVTRGDSFSAALPVGSSSIAVSVTAQDGTTTTYTVTVTRAAPYDATLSTLTVSTGTLSPAFHPAATRYTVTVGYSTREIIVDAATADSAASLSISGLPQSRATIPLSVGVNTVIIETESHDRTSTRTTTIDVIREAPPSPTIGFELGFAAGDDSDGAPVTLRGSNLLPGSTATVTMHSTPVRLATGTVLADGTIVLSARIPASVPTGAHRLVFEGTAMDGGVSSRTAWFTVLADGRIGAVSLSGPIPAQAAGVRALPVTGAHWFAPALLGTVTAVIGAVLLMLGAGFRRRTHS